MKPPFLLPLLAILSAGFAIPAAVNAQTIVLFGDSTTAKRGALKIYANHLAEAKLGGGNGTIINSGVPGDHTERARVRFEKDVIAHKPDLVVIQFGINDAAIDVWKNPPAKTSRVPLDVYRKNLVHFLTACDREGIPAILMTANPLRWNDKMRELYGKPPYDVDAVGGFEAPLLPYLEIVRDLAEETGVPLVDVHKEFGEFAVKEGKKIDDLLLDGIHPNELGHRVVAEALLPEVEKILAGRK